MSRIVEYVGAGFKPALARKTRTVRFEDVPRYSGWGKRLDRAPVGMNVADQPERRHAIPEIVRGFKTFSARRVNERAGSVVSCGSAGLLRACHSERESIRSHSRLHSE